MERGFFSNNFFRTGFIFRLYESTNVLRFFLKRLKNPSAKKNLGPRTITSHPLKHAAAKSETGHREVRFDTQIEGCSGRAMI